MSITPVLELSERTLTPDTHRTPSSVNPGLAHTVHLSALAATTLAALDHEIHLWMLPALSGSATRVGSGTSGLYSLLSEDECARASSFHFVEHQQAFVANRGRLRTVLAHYLGCLPEDLHFVHGAQGKPGLTDDQGRGLTFNLSHTDGLAVLALSRGRQIGVDVERVKALSDLLDIAQQQFSTAECRQLAALPAERQREAFYSCWTRKEAFLKGIGTGLARNLADFEVSLLPGAPAELLVCRWSPELCQSWRLHSLEPGDGHQGALAYEQDPHDSPLCLRTFTWSALDTSAQDS